MVTSIVCLVLFMIGAYVLWAWTQSVGPTAYRASLRQYAGLVIGNPVVETTLSGTTTTTLALTAGIGESLSPGMIVSGPNFSPGTSIVTVSNTQAILSQIGLGTALALTSFTREFFTNSVHLYKAPFAGGSDPTPASFTEADFTGYAAVIPNGGTPVYSLPDGSAETDLGDLSWVLLTTPALGNTIYGYWIDYVDPFTNTIIVAAWEDFPTPLPMNAAGNAVVLSLPLKMPLPGSAFVP